MRRNADEREELADAKGIPLREISDKVGAAFRLNPQGRVKSGALRR